MNDINRTDNHLFLKVSKISFIFLMLALIIYIFIQTAETSSLSTRPLPYRVVDNSLEVDGRYYYTNGIPVPRDKSITAYSINGYNYAVLGDMYKIYYSENMLKDNAFLFEYDSTTVSFVPKSIYLQSDPQVATKAQTTTASVSGSTVTYPAMFGAGTEYRLTYSSGFVKENLVFGSNPYPTATNTDTLVFKHRFDYSGLTPYINGAVWDGTSTNTRSEIIFRNSGETYFAFTKPYAVDATGKTADLSYDISKNKQTGEMNIKLNTPMSFLKNATYPVTIDPSLEQNGGSITLDGTQTYDFVNVTNGGIIYVTAYNGVGTTGTLTLNVTYDVNVDAASQILGDQRGGRGGAGGLYPDNPQVNGGEIAGSGGGAGGAGTSCAGGGGAGGYGAAGANGGRADVNCDGGRSGGAGGAAQGTSIGWDLQMGNGAGGGGSSNTNGVSGSAGQAGGAMLKINAGRNISIRGTVSMNGGNGGAGGGDPGNSLNHGGGGGGGASGGGILLNATKYINVSYATIRANAGSGGAGGDGYGAWDGSPGGSGGGGRIKFFYGTSVINTSATVQAASVSYVQTINAPTITGWGNNVTGNNTLTPRINISTGINFNATADQSIDTWSWFKDGVSQSNNFNNFSTSWNTLGVKTIDVTAFNVNGTTANKTWIVTVSDITPPWLVNESVRYPAVAPNTNNTISANFTDDTNISSAIVRIRAPNETEANYTMTCSPFLNTSTCTYTDTDTPNTGTYTITRYWVTDGSSRTANLSSALSFIVNSAPIINDWMNSITNNNTLYAIRANKSVSITFNISAGGVTSYQWYKDGSLQSGQAQANYTTSWDTLGNKNITATAANAYGTSTPVTWSVNITDITAPWLTTSSITSEWLFVQAYPVTINAEFGDDTNVSSAIVTVQNQNGSAANYTMTCTVASAANCSYIYSTTASIGGYNVLFFYPVDGSGNQRNITANMSFTTTAPPQGGGTGGDVPPPSVTPASSGSSSGGSPPAEEVSVAVPKAQPETNVEFRDITGGATEPQALDIARCLTDSLFMNNKCSSYNYGVVVEPFNWWVAIGAYLAGLCVVIIQSIRHDTTRNWLQETLIYGTATVVITAILVSVGFNIYILNYIFDSPKYFLTFLNFIGLGTFIAMIGDSYYYRRTKKVYKLKPSLPFDLK